MIHFVVIWFITFTLHVLHSNLFKTISFRSSNLFDTLMTLLHYLYQKLKRKDPKSCFQSSQKMLLLSEERGDADQGRC